MSYVEIESLMLHSNSCNHFTVCKEMIIIEQNI